MICDQMVIAFLSKHKAFRNFTVSNRPILNKYQFYSRGIVAGILIAFLIICFTSQGHEPLLGGRVGGDFPAFYGAGKIILSGDWLNLYNPESQRLAQKDCFADATPNEYLIYAYPPYIALILSPLAKLPFLVAYFIYSILMTAALFFACRYFKRLVPTASLSTADLMIIASLSYPMLRAVLGGQNTSLSLLCLLGAAFYLKSKKPIHSGIFLGIWFFKFQLALPALVLILFTGNFAVLLGVLPIAAIYYSLGTFVGGWQWPLWWIESGVRPFADMDRISNLDNFITIRAFFERLLGPESTFYWPMSIGVSILFFLVLLISWKKYYRKLPLACLALASILLLLISPHALYYDAGLALVAIGFISLGRTPAFVSLVLLSTWLECLNNYLPFQPTFLFLLILSVLVLGRLLKENSKDTALDIASS